MASPLEWIALGALLARPETLAETESRLWQTLEIRHAIESLPGDTVPLRHLLETHGCVWTGKGKSIDAVMESMLDAALEWHARQLAKLKAMEFVAGKPKVETEIVQEALDRLRQRARIATVPCVPDGEPKTDPGIGDVPATPSAKVEPRTSKPPSPPNAPPKSPKPSGKDSKPSGKQS